MKIVIGDEAYDDRDVKDLIIKVEDKALILPLSNGGCRGTDLGTDIAKSI